MSDNWVVQNLENALETWNEKLAEIWQLITTTPQDFKGGGIWGVIVNINGAVQSIGLALLVLFFVAGMVKTCGSFTEVKKPEHALKLFVRFAIAKGAITYGMELMLALFNIVQGTISTIMGSAGFSTPQKDKVNWDYFILLVAKTGMRFSEALALTPKDFDFAHQTLSISKTWDYKGKGGFQPTKNKSSVRKIQIDWQTVIQFSELVKHLPEDKPIFVNSTVYNSTVNDILGRHCKACNIPVISIHGLRHTHASLLLFTGVSIASVARRLGHSSMTTTQKTYLHIIQELENKDIDLVMRSLSGLS